MPKYRHILPKFGQANEPIAQKEIFDRRSSQVFEKP